MRALELFARRFEQLCPGQPVPPDMKAAFDEFIDVRLEPLCECVFEGNGSHTPTYCTVCFIRYGCDGGEPGAPRCTHIVHCAHEECDRFENDACDDFNNICSVCVAGNKSGWRVKTDDRGFHTVMCDQHADAEDTPINECSDFIFWSNKKRKIKRIT